MCDGAITVGHRRQAPVHETTHAASCVHKPQQINHSCRKTIIPMTHGGLSDVMKLAVRSSHFKHKAHHKSCCMLFQKTDYFSASQTSGTSLLRKFRGYGALQFNVTRAQLCRTKLKPDAQGIIQQPRTVSTAIRDKLKSHLHEHVEG